MKRVALAVKQFQLMGLDRSEDARALQCQDLVEVE
jgi:hypothetical protein